MGVEQTSRAVVSSACARRLGLAALAMLALGLALVLRLHQAAAPMTFDEYASLYFSDRPFGDLWGWWRAHPDPSAPAPHISIGV